MAIDMTIEWNDTINVKSNNGEEISVTYNKNVNANTKLHEVGKSYGVEKLVDDAPHWSHDGK